MKKSILAVLLAITLAAPVFASEKKDMDLDLKFGYTLDTNIKLYLEERTYSGATNRGCIFATDFYYYAASDLGLGLGVNYVLDSQSDYARDDKYGFTNVYFAIKPKMDLNSDILDSFYFMGQIGYGFIRLDSKADGPSPSVENGLYWGLGVGLEIMDHFVLELIHSFNYGYAKFGNDRKDIKYSELSINAGYKFNL